VNLRPRILLSVSLLVLLPLILLALGGRQQTAHRLERQHGERVLALGEILGRSLDRQRDELAEGLAALAAELRTDLELRGALADPGPGGRHRIDFAAARMSLMGWDHLQILDETGRILSSGHFREAFDRIQPGPVGALAALPGGSALRRARRPEGEFLALVRGSSLDLDGRRYWISGGREVDRAWLDALAGAGQLDLSLVLGDEVLVPGRAESAVWSPGPRLPYLDDRGAREEALLRLYHPRDSLNTLLHSFDLWLALALAITLAGSFLMASWTSSRLSRPLRELADRSSRLDLDRPGQHGDWSRPSERRDEVGQLDRTLSGLAERLGVSARQLREAERRATLGDLARQVTHDIRNGFTPLRNVINHLSELAREAPADLPRIFLERESTLAAGLGYLEDLASHYSRLSPERSQEAVDLNALLGELLPPGLREPGIVYRLDLDPALPLVQADPGCLRRIAENLIRNARESLADRDGEIGIATSRERNAQGELELVLGVSDDGPGIPADRLERIFDDFYTSKPGGSGLGLSIVRRLSADLGGRVEVGGEAGAGARFRVRLPLPDPPAAAARKEQP
jgi:signal transduction histidine kinase